MNGRAANGWCVGSRVSQRVLGVRLRATASHHPNIICVLVSCVLDLVSCMTCVALVIIVFVVWRELRSIDRRRPVQ